MERRENNESRSNDYYQSSGRILTELGIGPVTFCSQVLHTTDLALGFGWEWRDYSGADDAVSQAEKYFVWYSLNPLPDDKILD